MSEKATLAIDLLLGSGFTPYSSGFLTKTALSLTFIQYEPDAIGEVLTEWESCGLLKPAGSFKNEPYYEATEALWIEREKALRDQGWRHPALINQSQHPLDSLVLAIAMSSHIHNRRIMGRFLGESHERFVRELYIYLYECDSARVDLACNDLVQKDLLNRGARERHSHMLPTIAITIAGMRDYKVRVAPALDLSEDESVLDLRRKKETILFWAWQTDFTTSRNDIEKALKSVVQKINCELNPPQPLQIEVAVNPGEGAVRIDANLLAKIRVADFFVGDVTPVFRFSGRLVPNSNVLIETGYALASMEPDRVFLIENIRVPSEILGEGSEKGNFPFDISTVNGVRYSEPEQLAEDLYAELSACLRKRRVVR